MGKRARRKMVGPRYERSPFVRSTSDTTLAIDGPARVTTTSVRTPEERKLRVAVGAPVAERAWVLPSWFECLKAQTLRPDYFVFVYSRSKDTTVQQILNAPVRGAEVRIHHTKLSYYSRDERNADPKDPHRAEHLARVRNELRGEFLKTDADVFVSLDTDILLENPSDLQRMVEKVTGGHWDVAAGKVVLHPVPDSHCYNAGWFTTGANPEELAEQGFTVFTRPWERAWERDAKFRTSPVTIDIPMAAYAIRRHTMGMCSYKRHDQGEDIGFADSLQRHGARVCWLSDLPLRHVWDRSYL